MTISTETKKAIMSILIGACVLAMANTLQAIIDILLDYKNDLIPAASSIIYYLRSWKHIA